MYYFCWIYELTACNFANYKYFSSHTLFSLSIMWHLSLNKLKFNNATVNLWKDVMLITVWYFLYKSSISKTLVCYYTKTCSRDDHALLKWSLVTSEANKICELPNDVYPVDFHSYSRHQGTGKKHGQDQLLITSTDGTV